MFERYRQTGSPVDLITALLGQNYSQRPCPVNTSDIAGTTDVHGPVVPDDGTTLDTAWLTSPATLPTGFTYQVFYTLKGSRRYLAPPVSGAGTAVPAGTPFRLHKVDRLRLPVPAGSVLGVTVTRASGTLTAPTFTFVLTGG